VSRIVVLVLIAACLAPSCGREERSGARCGPITVEQIDPDEGHLIGGAAAPTFLTDPPTSGPHTPGAVVAGRRTEPVPRIVQVSTLETGAVIIQYGASVDPKPLERLVVEGVVLAPGTGFPDGEVIATGWLRKMTCVAIDIGALGTFIDTVRGRYGGHGTSTTVRPATPTTPQTTTEG